MQSSICKFYAIDIDAAQSIKNEIAGISDRKRVRDMTNEKLFEVLGEIDEKYVEGAKKTMTRKKTINFKVCNDKFFRV